MDAERIGPLAGLRVIARRPWLLLVWWIFAFLVLWATWRVKGIFVQPVISPSDLNLERTLRVVATNIGGAAVFMVATAVGLLAATRVTLSAKSSTMAGLRLGRAELRLLPVALIVGFAITFLSAALMVGVMRLNRSWAEAIVGVPIFAFSLVLAWKFAFAPAIAVAEPATSPFRSWSMSAVEAARVVRIVIPACGLCLLIYVAYRLGLAQLKGSLLARVPESGLDGVMQRLILWQLTLYALVNALIWPLLASPVALLFAERRRNVADVF